MINVMTSLLEVSGLTVELPTPAGWVRPVNEVSLRIGAGESLGLVGESGSGKNDAVAGGDGFAPAGCARERRSIACNGNFCEKPDELNRARMALRPRRR